MAFDFASHRRVPSSLHWDEQDDRLLSCEAVRARQNVTGSGGVNKMLKIRCSDVPTFLGEGSFFQNLDLEDEDEFEVPEDSFKPDLVIDSHRDLLLLLNMVLFWGLSEVPVEVSSYLLCTGDVTDHTHLIDEFPDLTPYLKKILHVKVRSSNRS